MNCHIFNISQIERDDGNPLFLEFYGGDITELDVDVLLISAFKDSYVSTPGTVFRVIKDKFGLEFGSELPNDAKELCPGLYEFPVKNKNAKFRKLWVLEINRTSDKSDYIANLNRAFISLERAGQIFDIENLLTVSMPLLGTGEQGIDQRESSLKIMHTVKSWSNKSKNLGSVKVVAYNMEAASILNRVIDSFFGGYFETDREALSKLFSAATEELQHHIAEFSGDIEVALNELHEIADNKHPSIKSIAIQGRILAEICSRKIYENEYSKKPTSMTLNELIQKISHSLLKNYSWILSYLRLLQSCGNNAAHNLGERLNLADACAVIISSIRLTEYINLSIKAQQ